MKRSIIALSLAIGLTMLPTNAAAAENFTDVPDRHWASSCIQALADGGLVGGYGDGCFGPDDALNIDQMARIICNAKGLAAGNSAGYWAENVIREGIKGYWLPDMGAITGENYSKPCSRELAVYMMTKGLGVPGNAAPAPGVRIKDIPDYDSIDTDYASTILKAYQWGLITGTDQNRTFDPKAILSRAQACTVLYRAGFTEKKEAAIPSDQPAAATKDIFTSMLTMSDFELVTDYMGIKAYSSNDAIIGGTEISYNENSKLLGITLYEVNEGAMFKDGHIVDVNGNRLSNEVLANGFIDPKTGKLPFSTGYGYEGRQFAKKLLTVAFPNDAEEAYEALFGVIKQELYECPGEETPSALRWIGNRSLAITSNPDNHNITITMSDVGVKTLYEAHASAPAVGHGKFRVNYGTEAQYEAMFEINRG